MKTIHNIAIIILSILTLSVNAESHNTAYAAIIEVKVWETYYDIYSENEIVCAHSDKHRLVLDKANKEMFAAALAAMTSGMLASIKYTCDTNSGIGRLQGIRVKPNNP